MSGKPNDKVFKTMIEKFGSEEAARDWYRSIGARGGANGVSGGFASYVVGDDGLTGRERAHVAGKKGGTISKRVSKKLMEVK